MHRLLVALTFTMILTCGCTTEVEYNMLEVASSPFRTEGVEIRPAFYPSKQRDWRGLDRGGPWHLYVTCDAPSDALSLTISSADVEGQDWKESLVPLDRRKCAAFRKMADGSTWIQVAFKDKAIERTIQKDAPVELTLRGEVVMKSGTVAFEHEFEFKSVIVKKDVEYNPLIDR